MAERQRLGCGIEDTASRRTSLGRIAAAVQAAAKAGLAKSDYEIQMLYGLRSKTWRQLVAEGHTVRVYMPYGTHWFPYYTRRIRERKENLFFVVRNIFN